MERALAVLNNFWFYKSKTDTLSKITILCFVIPDIGIIKERILELKC